MSDGSCVFSTPTGGVLYDSNCDGVAEKRTYTTRANTTATAERRVDCSPEERVSPLDVLNPCSFFVTHDDRDLLLSKLKEVVRIIHDASPQQVMGMFKFEKTHDGSYGVELTYDGMGGFTKTAKLFLTDTNTAQPGPERIAIVEEGGSKTFVYEHRETIEPYAPILEALYKLCEVKLAQT